MSAGQKESEFGDICPNVRKQFCAISGIKTRDVEIPRNPGFPTVT